MTCGNTGAAYGPEDVCSVHIEHDVRLVLLEGAVHLVQQPLVAADVCSRGLQAWSVDKLDPDACHCANNFPDTLGGWLESIGGSSFILVQYAVDGGTLANSSHAHDHDCAGEGQGLVRVGCLQALSCTHGGFKAIGSAGRVAGLRDADTLC